MPTPRSFSRTARSGRSAERLCPSPRPDARARSQKRGCRDPRNHLGDRADRTGGRVAAQRHAAVFDRLVHDVAAEHPFVAVSCDLSVHRRASRRGGLHRRAGDDSGDRQKLPSLSGAHGAYGDEPVLSLTRAWTLVRYFDSGMLQTNTCTRCGGRFVAYADLRPGYVCGLCQPPLRASKTKKPFSADGAPDRRVIAARLRPDRGLKAKISTVAPFGRSQSPRGFNRLRTVRPSPKVFLPECRKPT